MQTHHSFKAKKATYSYQCGEEEEASRGLDLLSTPSFCPLLLSSSEIFLNLLLTVGINYKCQHISLFSDVSYTKGNYNMFKISPTRTDHTVSPRLTNTTVIWKKKKKRRSP